MAGRVLVVDGMADVRETMRLVLEIAGYSVTVATNGAEALVRCAEAPPDAVLVSSRLPDLDPGEFCARLRTVFPAPPVTMLGHTPFDQPRADACDAAFLCIPCTAADLLAAVDRVTPSAMTR